MSTPARWMIHGLVLFSGAAALSWEVLWQIRASLAIGVSAMGTAITLVATMGGMALGSLAMGRVLERRRAMNPASVYAGLEIVIGVCGSVLLVPGFALLARLDASIYVGHPALANVVDLAGMLVLLGPPTLAMGATIPVFGLLAASAGSSIANLYAVNTAGAALGVIFVSFLLIPALGVEVTGIALGCVNLCAALACLTLRKSVQPREELDAPSPREPSPREDRPSASIIVFVTGLVILGLEVAWFRALRAAFQSTTETFAILLVSVLAPLALGAHLAPRLARRRIPVASMLAAGGVAVIVTTPLVERFDVWFGAVSYGSADLVVARLAASLVTLAPPFALLGTCLPYVLKEHARTTWWAKLYALNSLGCVVGSLVVAWVMLPSFGSERTAWMLGAVALAGAVAASRARPRLWVGAAAAAALGCALLTQSGGGRTRVQGVFPNPIVRVIAFAEGPDSSIAVADDSSGDRILVVDGFAATSQGTTTHYLSWMGRLPMLLHPAPEQTLVICFGTGQTANGVREEGPTNLDIVELSPAVFSMAPLFDKNGGVLEDPRVHPIVMDGRAWLRRTDHTYDVVTLEPMPPNFAGVNALYSLEFYRLVESRLKPGGVVAQWLPFHLLSLEDATSIAATFHEVFSDALLWIDPVDFSGVMVGRVARAGEDLAGQWPGLLRPSNGRDMSPEQIMASVKLDRAGVERYSSLGRIVTDDNQLLAYGAQRRLEMVQSESLMASHFDLLVRAGHR